MDGLAIMQEIIGILVGGISQVANGIGAGLSTLAQSIFLTTSGETTTLSAFGVLIIVFAGISLALGLCRLVYQFLTSLGSRNR